MSALDPEVLAQLRIDMGDDDTFRELVDIYLGEAPRLLANLHAAADREDPGGMALAAHTLKSTSATFGAAHMAQLCADIETFARHQAVAPAIALVPRVDEAFAEVRQGLAASKATRGENQWM